MLILGPKMTHLPSFSYNKNLQTGLHPFFVPIDL